MTSDWEFPDAGPPIAEPWPIEKLGFPTPSATEWTTPDAVIVIPGFMGSELIDTRTNTLLWGLSPRVLGRFWLASPKALAPLRVDEGTPIVPGRLLRATSFAPVLAGQEPYGRLLAKLATIVHHPSAIREFGYDWRLPVRHNARRLAEVVQQHLRNWRTRSGRTDVRVHLVAHSMGGLLCHELTQIPGALDDVTTVVTLGTPFDGAAKAVLAIGSGRIDGPPLPARRLRELAITMPGIYDLLPGYRCVDAGDSVRRLTPADIENIGGRADLASAAFADRVGRANVPIPGHRPMLGILQPTVSSVRFDAGEVNGLFDTFEVEPNGDLRREPDGTLLRRRAFGDGTVPRNSATPPQHLDPATLPQQHGPIAQSDEAIAFVKDRILHRPGGPRLGDTEIGIQLPDIVAVGTPFELGVEFAGEPVDAAAPNRAGIKLVDIASNRQVWQTRAQTRTARTTSMLTVQQPGLHRVEVSGGGTSPVSQLFLAVPAE